MHSHQDAAHGQQEHAACLRSHRTKYKYRNIKNKWVNKMVSDNHQGSTTQEKSSALKKMTCSLLVSVFDWQLLGYGKNHTTEEMTVILFDWSSIFSAKKSVRAFVSFHKFCWFCWPPSSLVEKNWAAKPSDPQTLKHKTKWERRYKNDWRTRIRLSWLSYIVLTVTESHIFNWIKKENSQPRGRVRTFLSGTWVWKFKKKNIHFNFQRSLFSCIT